MVEPSFEQFIAACTSIKIQPAWTRPGWEQLESAIRCEIMENLANKGAWWPELENAEDLSYETYLGIRKQAGLSEDNAYGRLQWQDMDDERKRSILRINDRVRESRMAIKQTEQERLEQHAEWGSWS